MFLVSFSFALSLVNNWDDWVSWWSTMSISDTLSARRSSNSSRYRAFVSRNLRMTIKISFMFFLFSYNSDICKSQLYDKVNDKVNDKAEVLCVSLNLDYLKVSRFLDHTLIVLIFTIWTTPIMRRKKGKEISPTESKMRPVNMRHGPQKRKKKNQKGRKPRSLYAMNAHYVPSHLIKGCAYPPTYPSRSSIHPSIQSNY